MKTEYTNDSKKKSKAQSKNQKILKLFTKIGRHPRRYKGSRNDSDERFMDNILLPECYPKIRRISACTKVRTGSNSEKAIYAKA